MFQDVDETLRAVLLADDLMAGPPGGLSVLAQMAEQFKTLEQSMLAVQEVPLDQTRRYGIVAGEKSGGKLMKVSAMVEKARRGEPVEVTEESINAHLYTAGLPEPDLLIRTSGELRISNFLLWQIAYAELYVTDTLWPDFGRNDLLRAILDYQKRDRRFGGLSPACETGVEEEAVDDDSVVAASPV